MSYVWEALPPEKCNTEGNSISALHKAMGSKKGGKKKLEPDVQVGRNLQPQELHH